MARSSGRVWNTVEPDGAHEAPAKPGGQHQDQRHLQGIARDPLNAAGHEAASIGLRAMRKAPRSRSPDAGARRNRPPAIPLDMGGTAA